MSTRATSNIPNNTVPSKSSGGHASDEHAKPMGPAVFAQKSASGNVVEIWADGAIWDTVANKHLTTDQVVRNG